MVDESDSPLSSGYTVVARRYRPKSFGELVGQDHIATALGNAISSNRVGHAYLFTGARGVGKTSTARIFAKALNISADMADDIATDIAQAIDAGEDMDVIEIDGASNRGIEEIRQLRSNVNVRPSRSTFKIYIIDEVHMLTNQAFNALLKTLEEPPAHVKFIFCTTDPDKIPITVLSRCQRFDFAPVKFEAIHERLKEICASEGFEAEEEALALLARRAAGSMRDSQSLLEQVLSFSSGLITADQVHALLGTADEGRLLALANALQAKDALQAIDLVDQSIRGGADAGQLSEQLLNYLRDVMAVGIGGNADLLKLANPAGFDQLKSLADQWGVETILSAIQILDEALVRMRASVSAVTLLEVALVQICQLEHLASIPDLLERVALAGTTGPAASPSHEKKKPNAQAPLKPAPNQSTVNSPSPAQVPPEHEPQVSLSSQTAVQPADEGPAATVGAPQLHQQAGTEQSEAKAGDVSTSTEPRKPVGEPSTVREATAESTQTTNGSHAQASAPPASESHASGASEDATHPVQAAAPAETPLANAGGTPGPAKTPAGSTATGSAPSGVVSAAEPSQSSSQPQASGNALGQWKQIVATIDGMLADFAGMAAAVEPLASDHWRIVFPPGANKPCEYCDVSERKSLLQTTVGQALGRSVRLEFSVMPGEAPKPVAAAPQSTLRVMKMREMSEHPYVKKLCEVLDGEIIRVDSPREPPVAKNNSQGTNRSSQVGGQ